MLWATRVAAYATIGAAIAGSISVYLFYTLTSRQLREMQAEQRPWASIDAEISSDLVFTNPGDPKLAAAHVTIKITVSNPGKSPALNLIIDGDCANTLIYGDLFQGVTRKLETTRKAQGAKPLIGETIFPGQTVTREKPICTKEGDWAAFLGYQSYISDDNWAHNFSPTYYGVIAYRYEGEPPSWHHQTGFAFTVVRKDGKPIAAPGATLPNTIPMSDLRVERINDPVNGVFFAY